jgi:hypothetical protein
MIREWFHGAFQKFVESRRVHSLKYVFAHFLEVGISGFRLEKTAHHLSSVFVEVSGIDFMLIVCWEESRGVKTRDNRCFPVDRCGSWVGMRGRLRIVKGLKMC